MKRLIAVSVYLILLAVPLAEAATGARSPLVLTAGMVRAALGDHLQVLEDADGVLTVDDLTTAAFRSDVSVPAFSRGVYWYRFTVVRAGGTPADWMLALGPPAITDIGVFVPGPAGGWTKAEVVRRPAVGTPSDLVRLSLPDGVPQTIYVRLASPLLFAFRDVIWQPDALISAEIRDAAVTSLHVGALAVVAVLYAIFGLWLRIPAMIAYAAYCGATLMSLLAITGLIAVLAPDAGALSIRLLRDVGLIVGPAALVLMWDRILRLDRDAPRLHRLYLGLAAAMAAGLPLVSSPGFGLVNALVTAASLGIACVSLGLIARAARRHPPDILWLLYGAAQVAFVVSTADKFAKSWGLVVPEYNGLPQIAGMTHLLILCLVLALHTARIELSRRKAEEALAGMRDGLNEQRNFIAMIGHQLRIPMAMAAAAAGALELRPERRDQIAIIHQAVLRMRAFTDGVLSDHRLDGIGMNARLEAVDLGALLETLHDERRMVAPGLRLTHDRQAAILEGDRIMLGVLFANLLDNAIAYTPPSGAIRVELAVDFQGVTVTVADSGPGIAPDEAEHVFEKFYRSAGSADRPGFGLGLYLVRRIADRHGGTVRLVSPPGRGATFIVRLPHCLDADP